MCKTTFPQNMFSEVDRGQTKPHPEFPGVEDSYLQLYTSVFLIYRLVDLYFKKRSYTI